MKKQLQMGLATLAVVSTVVLFQNCGQQQFSSDSVASKTSSSLEDSAGEQPEAQIPDQASQPDTVAQPSVPQQPIPSSVDLSKVRGDRCFLKFVGEPGIDGTIYGTELSPASCAEVGQQHATINNRRIAMYYLYPSDVGLSAGNTPTEIMLAALQSLSPIAIFQ